MKIKDLVKHKVPFPAHIKGGNTGGVTSKWIRRTYNSVNLGTEDVIVTNILEYNDYMTFDCIDPKSQKYDSSSSFRANVSSDFEMELLDDKHPINESWMKFVYNNLDKILKHNFKIGSDPEIFVEDESGNCIPAFLFLGSKEIPDYTPNYGGYNGRGNCHMYWDGFQAEFATHADQCLELHSDSIAAGLKGIYDAAKKKFPKSRLSMVNVFDIPYDMLLAADDEHVNFGCMPSYNAYGLEVRMPPPREAPFRSAGGHIHFGLNAGFPATGAKNQALDHKNATPIVKALDAILGVACVSLFASFDDPRRRILYGLPGEYRLPPHGLEYRPLSNAWLSHPLITNLVFDLARKVVVFSQKGLIGLWNSSEEETLNTIIKCDIDKAREIIERNKSVFLKFLRSSYDWASDKELEIIYGWFFNGLETAIKDPADFVSNWNLESNWIMQGGNKNVFSSLRLRHDNNGIFVPYSDGVKF